MKTYYITYSKIAATIKKLSKIIATWMANKKKITENQLKTSKAGGALIGKRNGQTIIHNKGTLGGYAVGRLHSEGGIKGKVAGGGQDVEFQGGEVTITAPSVAMQQKQEFNGEMLTNRQILSRINEAGGGVSFAEGGEIPQKIKYSGKKYTYGGKLVKDHDIISSCGCEHEDPLQQEEGKFEKGGKLYPAYQTGKLSKQIIDRINSGSDIKMENGGEMDKLYPNAIAAFKNSEDNLISYITIGTSDDFFHTHIRNIDSGKLTNGLTFQKFNLAVTTAKKMLGPVPIITLLYNPPVVEKKEIVKEKKTWMDFMSYQDRNRIPLSLQSKSKIELLQLLENKIKNRDASYTPARQKLILREEVWQLNDLISAHLKAEEYSQ